jgi:hypothetical protein
MQSNFVGIIEDPNLNRRTSGKIIFQPSMAEGNGFNSQDSYKSYHSGFSDKPDGETKDDEGPSLNFETTEKPDSSDNIIDEVN